MLDVQDGDVVPEVGARRAPRAYQLEGLAAVRRAYRAGKRAILLVMPTGAGKTFMGSSFAVGAIGKGGDLLWLAHRSELLKQAQASLMREGLPHVGIISPDHRRQNAPVQVASVQTLVAQARKGRAMPRASVVIFDEAHHAGADEWLKIAKSIVNKSGNSPLIIGLTATPERGDGRPMGIEAGGLFDELIPVSSVRELQELGVLVPCVTYSPETKTKHLSREPVEAYQEHGAGERGFVFCASVAHAEQIAETFRDAGIPASTIHADTPWRLRTARLEAFREQSNRPLRKVGSIEDAPLVLCNVYTLTEGVDVPEASVCITARGIGHSGMMRQMVGRVLRCAPGKTRAIWWDLRGASKVRDKDGKLKIGLPESDCTYSLEGKAIEVNPDAEAKQLKCKACSGKFDAWASDAEGRRFCPGCGAEPPELGLPITVDREMFAHGSGASLFDRTDALDRLAITAADRGYRQGWIAVRFSEQFGSMPAHAEVDAAVARARATLGIRVAQAEIDAERERLIEIANRRAIPRSWVIKKLIEKYGEAAA